MSRLSDAAYQWLLEQSQNAAPVTTAALWHGMQKRFPELTATSPTRKTPRSTLMRDLRRDKRKRFFVGGGHVRLLRRDADA